MNYSDMLEDDAPTFADMLESRKACFKLWPTSGDKTALIDADLIPYKVGFTIDPMDLFSAKRTVELGCAECIDDTEQFKRAAESVDWMINYWIESAGCDSAKLYITDAPKQYRFDVAISEKYKGEREGREKPPFFYELKRYIVNKHKAIVATDCEADDLISIEAELAASELESQGVTLGSETHREFSTHVIVSIDKDIMINPGLHFNPDKQEFKLIDRLGYLEPIYSKKEVNKYENWPTINGEPINLSSDDPRWGLVDTFKRGNKAGTHKTKRVLVGTVPSSAIDKLKGGGLKFFYSQLITGDDVDCYSGLQGAGKTAAFNLLDCAKSEQELFNRVADAYRQHHGESCTKKTHDGRTITTGYLELLAEQGNLAWMQRHQRDLWSNRIGVLIPWFNYEKHGFERPK